MRELLKGGSIRNWIPEPAGGGSKGTSRMNSALLRSKETQKRMERPMKEIFTAIAFAVLLTAVPALAADTSTNNKPASSTSSGPGVKGAPGNKNGPAAQPNSMDKAGSSSGTADTQPSQDAKGVKGAPGNKSGPAEKPNTTGK